MILLRWNEGCEPQYMTSASSCCDVQSAVSIVVQPFERVLVPTGIWIAEVQWDKVPGGSVPELQLRARSGLALRAGLMLANGVGTIDADFQDEIKVLLLNASTQSYHIEQGDRIAQLCLTITMRIPELMVHGHRKGGFGSTGLGGAEKGK